MQPVNKTGRQKVYDVLVIGAGQAGLAIGYYLQAQGADYLILDATARVGQSWRDRYDSLRLFTPAEYCQLPGWPLLLPKGHYPTKDQMADYLEQYAQHFKLPLRLQQRVLAVTKAEGIFYVKTEHHTLQARQLVIATGPFQKPFVPKFTAVPATEVVQVHSSEYRHPGQLPPGRVLVVGAGNSGAQIAVELARTHEVHLSIKKQPVFSPLRKWGKSIFWWGTKTRALFAAPTSFLGKKLRMQGDVIYGHELQQALERRHIQLQPEIAGFTPRQVLFKDGSSGSYHSILWATGFRAEYGWLQIPEAFDAEGQLQHQQGLSPVSGLYFLGLPWQRSRSSALLLGAGPDAHFIAKRLI